MATKKPKQTDAKVWKRRFQIAQQNQQRMFDKFAYWYDLMYAHVNQSQYALWRSKVFLPIIPAKAWAMVGKLTQLDPGFETALYGEHLNDPNAEQMADKMEWKLKHDWFNPDLEEPMRDKLYNCLVDAVVTGTGIGMVSWTPTNKIRYEHAEDEQLEGELDFSNDVRIETQSGYNDFVPVDVMSTFIAPGAKNIQGAAWIIIEDFVTYDQLKEVNDNAGFEFYKNLDEVKDLKATNDANAIYKKSRERLTLEQDPVSADKTVQQFRRYQCFEKSTGYFYTFAAGESASGSSDEWIELNCRQNPYWHGKCPVVAFYVKKRPHSVWGQGVFEDMERVQSAFNDLFNHYMDNLNLSLDGMVMKEAGEEWVYTVEPGGEFLYTNKPPQQFKFPEPNPGQFNTVMNFLEMMVERTTVSDYATGVSSSQTDKTSGTASGIMALQNAAGDKLGFMKQNFQTALREIGTMWLINNQQFVDQPTTVMGRNEKGQSAPVDVHPRDLQAPMLLHIDDASMEPENKQQQLQNLLAFQQQLFNLQDRSIQQAQMTKWSTTPLWVDFVSQAQDLANQMGMANVDKLLIDGKEVEQLMQTSQSPFIMPKEEIRFDLNELYGSEASQLLQRNGLQPDQARQTQVPVSKDGNPVNPLDREAMARAGLPVYGRDSLATGGMPPMPPQVPTPPINPNQQEP